MEVRASPFVPSVVSCLPLEECLVAGMGARLPLNMTQGQAYSNWKLNSETTPSSLAPPSFTFNLIRLERKIMSCKFLLFQFSASSYLLSTQFSPTQLFKNSLHPPLCNLLSIIIPSCWHFMLIVSWHVPVPYFQVRGQKKGVLSFIKSLGPFQHILCPKWPWWISWPLGGILGTGVAPPGKGHSSSHLLKILGIKKGSLCPHRPPPVHW